MFSKKNLIVTLAGYPNRGAGTESERKAANYIENEMIKIGLSVSRQDFRAPTRMPIIHFVHFFLLFLASLLANFFPLGATIVGGLVVLSFWGEFTHRFFILRYLTPHGKSQNIIGKMGKDDSNIKIVLSAHMDAAKAGFIFNSKLSNGAGKLKHQPLHKSLLIIMLVLVTVFVVKVFGGGTWILSIIFNSVAVFSLIASFVMIQWELSPYAQGANDDLSAVACMLGVADKTKSEDLKDIQLIFVATGAEESHCNGMRVFLKKNSELDKEKTYFINLECLGGGRLKYVTEEGFIIFQRHDHTLIQIADIVSKKYGYDFKPTYTVAHSESIVPLTSGYKSIGLIALNENNVPTNYHQKSDIPENIDYDLINSAEEVIIKMLEVLKEFKTNNYI